MPLNPLFEGNAFNAEQNVVEDLIIEAIQIHGINTYYLPRTGVNHDSVMNEDAWSEYNSATDIEMWVKSFDAFEGDGQILGNWGVEIRDRLTLTVARKRFKNLVSEEVGNIGPRDGDIVYIPTIGSAYRITYVDSTNQFYQLGKLFVYDLKLELLEYSRDKFNTGIDEIDEKYNQYALSNQNRPPVEDDAASFFNLFSDNQVLQDAGEEVLDFSESSPFGVSE